MSSFSLKDIGTWLQEFQVWPVDRNGRNFPRLDASYSFEVYNDPPAVSFGFGARLFRNESVRLVSNAQDTDGGPLAYVHWSVQSRPPNSVAQLSDAASVDPSIRFATADLGHWSVQLDVADNEGELKTFTKAFDVVNRAPAVTISGKRSLDPGEDIRLEVGPEPDADGDSVEWRWDVLSAPPNAAVQPQTSFSTDRSIVIPTSVREIGTWRFACEGVDALGSSTTETVEVVVRKLPPKITITPMRRDEDVGATVTFETTTLEDAYGAPMSDFRWDLVQAPAAAGVPPARGVEVGPTLSRQMRERDAGTWRWKLTVTDQIGETAEAVVTAVIDAPPIATIDGPGAVQQSAELKLSGASSVDPDSLGHTALGEVVDVTPGIVAYQWSIAEAPATSPSLLGPVEDVFGVIGSGSEIAIPTGRAPPGRWLFELRVSDGERNSAVATKRVEVRPEAAEPVVVLSPSRTYTTSATGALATDIVVDASATYDPDNGSSGGSGQGIDEYAWRVTTPEGCAKSPTVPSGSSAATLTVFPAGTILEQSCLGVYVVVVDVTDDDTPAQQATGSTEFRIGNCPGAVCIDFPTAAAPAYVKFSEKTDVIVRYRLNSLLYDQQAFVSGLQARLLVFREPERSIPFFSRTWDVNPLPSDAGGALSLHWSGYGDNGVRPPPGIYGLRLELLDANGDPTGYVAEERDAIRIQVMGVQIDEAASDRFVSALALRQRTGSLSINYRVVGRAPGESGPGFDELRVRIVEDATSHEVYRQILLPPLDPIYQWFGTTTSGIPPAPGDYWVELQPMQDGALLGAPTEYAFNVFGPRDLGAWSELLSFRPPAAVQFFVHNKAPFTSLQHIEEACGTLNLDYYPVRVSTLPEIQGCAEARRASWNTFDSSLTPFSTPVLRRSNPSTR
jgi:hypothetical protein